MQVHQAAADAHAAGPDVVQAARHPRTAVPRAALSRPGRGAHVRHAAFLDDERGGFPRRVFRERDRQGPFRRQLDHRHGAGPALARQRLRAAASLHGRHRRHGRRVGVCARRHGCGQRGARRLAAGERRHDPAVGAGRANRRARRTRRRRRARGRRGNLGAARGLEPRRAPHLPRDDERGGSAGRVPAPGSQFQDPRLVGKAEHRARRPAAISRDSRTDRRARAATCT